MPIRLTHIVDEHTPEDALRQLSLLLRRLPADRGDQCVISVGSPPAGLAVSAYVPLWRLSRRMMPQTGLSWEWRRALRECRPQVLHAWGTSAATVARLVRPAGVPIALTVTDPAETDDVTRWWPFEADLGSERRGTVICASEFVRRRLVGSGIPREATAVVRPGVDCEEIERGRRKMRRADLGLPEGGRVLLTASPATRAGGQFSAVWAAAILFQVWSDVRLVIPGRSREQDRIRRLIDGIYCPQVYLLTEDEYSPAELLAVSDLLVVPAIEAGPTDWIAAAMMAGVPVTASNLPSVTELVRDDETGFLCRPGEPHTLAIRIRTAMETPGAAGRCAAAASRRAAEWFNADRCAEAYEAAYAALAGVLAEGG